MKNTENKYQTDYSRIYQFEIENEQNRHVKAKKTLSIIQDILGADKLKQCKVLEVGCFTGEISILLAENFMKYTAIDIDENAIQLALKKNILENLSFIHMNAEAIKFNESEFDIVICSHVYEHVPNPSVLMNEIFRVLKPDGICYFAAGNRLCLIEPHYKLPFLSILPKIFAHKYLKLF